MPDGDHMLIEVSSRYFGRGPGISIANNWIGLVAANSCQLRFRAFCLSIPAQLAHQALVMYTLQAL